MQHNLFIGQLAKAPEQVGSGDRAVTHFTLISNEYAGRDASGETRERVTSLRFSAFRAIGEQIHRHALKGDQLAVTYRIENNVYEQDGRDVYGYNFVVENFTFGAPGKAKRAELDERRA